MKAVSLTGPKTCELIDSPIPESNGEDVIIDVSMCGICGSDLHFWHNGVGMDNKPGLIMGHEFSGTVHDPGNRTDLKQGDRVTALPINPCGTCDSCVRGSVNTCLNGMFRPAIGISDPGGYAEYCHVRADMVRVIPDTLSDEDAALIEPATVALHAVRQSGLMPGQKVLISGGGPVGLLAAIWAKQLGASQVVLTEVNEFRMDFAKTKLGITDVFDAREKVVAKTLKKQFGGFDVVIESSAVDAGLILGAHVLNPRGTLVLAGISYTPQSVPTLLCTVKELSIKTAYGYTPEEFDMTLDHVARKAINISPLVTQVIEPEATQEAMENLASGSSTNLKVLIKF